MSNLFLFISAFYIIISATNMHYLTEFKESDSEWFTVNDGVMGGLSSSRIRVENDGTSTFEGKVSLENNGGFASVRMNVNEELSTDYNFIKLRVFGDGNTYNFRIRKNESFDGLAYDYPFKTEKEEWIDVSIPLDLFQGTYRGRKYQNKIGVKADEISQIGILIGGKQEGLFKIKLDYIALSK